MDFRQIIFIISVGKINLKFNFKVHRDFYLINLFAKKS